MSAASTFEARVFEAASAERACRLLAEQAGTGEWDSGLVGEALGHAVQAFPGLQEFADGLADPGELKLDTSALSIEGNVFLEAAARLAEIGAAAELEGGFEWHDVERVALACTAAADAGIPAPTRR